MTWLLLALGCGPGTVELDLEDCALETGVEALAWDEAVPGTSSPRALALALDCSADPGPVAWTASLSGPLAGLFEVEPASGTLERVGEVLEVRLDLDDRYDPASATLEVAAASLSVEVDLRVSPLADRDGDGHDAVAASGDDCDDADPEVFPGAEDLPWDGVDADCGGEDDCDLDGDGFAAVPCGGDDCDDEDPDRHPGTGTAEEANLADDDCDGLVDEDFLTTWDVVVAEVMVDPAAALDRGGEWIEVESRAAGPVDLRAWHLRSGTDEVVVVPDHLVLQPGERAVLGSTLDVGRTGGVPVDLAWTWGELRLEAGGDSLELLAGERPVHALAWDGTWPVEPGASLSLHPDLSPSSRGHWCASSSPMPGGDHGTPGEVNDPCGQLDGDGDGWSTDDGDCDDGDADVRPDADEAWNGVDDDCSGVVDDVDVEDVTSGWLIGSAGDEIGARFALSALDMDEDGDVELFLGAPASRGGGSWFLEVSPLLAGKGSRVTGTTVDIANYCCVAGPAQGDVDGDGAVDLVVAAQGERSDSGPILAWYEGGAAPASQGGSVEAEGLEELPRVLSHLDLDGDGLAEGVLGLPSGVEDLVTSTKGLGAVLVMDLDALEGGWSLADLEVPWLVGTARHDHLGSTLGGGDLDGDGVDDLLVGSGGDDLGGVGAGAVYLLDAAEPGWEGDVAMDAAEWALTGADPWENLGSTGFPQVADYDDDGHADLAVASPALGAVWVFFGDGGPWSGTATTDDADLVIDGAEPNFLGTELATGDLDGDGVPELIASAPDSDHEYRPDVADEVGAVFVFQPSGSGAWTSEDAWRSLEGLDPEDLFGLGLLVADFDGDGLDDLVVAAPGDYAGAGTVYGVPSP